jgi:hypothetical protein
MTRLNVWCLSGLGNRVRSLLGARELSERHGWRFSYTWDDHSAALSAELDDLWEQDFERTSRTAATLRRLPRRDFLSGDQRTWPAGTESRQWIDLKTGDYIVDRDGERLDWGRQLRALRPSHAVAERLRATSEEMGTEQYVGVMIRAHEASHPKTKEFSPVSWYEQRIRELLDEQPGLRFFVSCDVPEVTDALVARFPAAVTQHDKGGYNTTVGTQAAVADVYMLAASAGILRPFFSSFTTMSSELADRALLLEDSQSDERLTAASLVPRAPDVLRPWDRERG